MDQVDQYEEDRKRTDSLWRLGTLVGIVAVFLFGVVAICGTAHAKERITGPVPAEVIRVIDGDTIVVRAEPWLGLSIETSVRIWGVDTPELRGKCPEEKVAATKARQVLIDFIGIQRRVVLFDITWGKYAGRVVALVRVADAPESLDVYLIAGGHGRRYFGGKRKGWCK